MTNASERSSGVGGRIARAGILVAVGHMLFKLAGLVQTAVMGRTLSAEVYDVVYGFAFENCIYTLFLLGEEVIGPALMPMFMRELDREDRADGERSAWAFTHSVLRIQWLLLAALVAVLLLAPEGFVRVFTRWTASRTPEQFELATASVRSLAPALFGLSLASTTYVVLNAYKRFFLASFADAVWKLFVAAVLVLGVALSPFPVRPLLVFGLVIGSLLKLATHCYGLWDRRALFRVRPDFRHPALRRLLHLMLPLMAGVVFAKSRDVFNNVYVLSGLEQAGLIQANSMGRKLAQALAMLVPYTLSIAMFPFLCEFVDRRDPRGLAELLTRSGRMLLSLLAPVTLTILVVATPLTALLFAGGEFDAQAVALTAISMACYTTVLPAAALEMLLMQAFFAHRRTYSVTAVGLCFSALSIALSYLAVVTLGWQGPRALAAVAGGFSLSRWLKTLTLIVLLRRNAPIFPLRPTGIFCLATAAMGGGCALAAAAGLRLAALLPLPDGRLRWIAQLALAGLCAAGAFVVGCIALRIREPHDMLRWAVARTRRKR